jgi:hypothetical protein
VHQVGRRHPEKVFENGSFFQSFFDFSFFAYFRRKWLIKARFSQFFLSLSQLSSQLIEIVERGAGVAEE